MGLRYLDRLGNQGSIAVFRAYGLGSLKALA